MCYIPWALGHWGKEARESQNGENEQTHDVQSVFVASLLNNLYDLL